MVGHTFSPVPAAPLFLGLHRRPTAATWAVLVVIITVSAVLFSIGTGCMAGRRAPSSVTFRPGEAAASNRKSTTESNEQDAYTAAALSNLTEFRDSLLSIANPFFGVGKASQGKNNATNLWKLLKPIISCPPDEPMVRYGGGGGDGTKLLCRLKPKSADRPCLVYSLGSNGDYSFEQSILKETSCNVSTFDCTYNGTSQGPRHSYYNWCVGDAQHGPGFRSWANITTTLGHSRVDVMKIDIEGHEYRVFSLLDSKDPTLPRQIAVEFHFGDARLPYMAQTGAELAFTFLHLARLGYAAFYQEINPIAQDCCAEVSFYKLT